MGNANSGRKGRSLVTDALIVEIKSREKDGDKRGVRRMAVTIMDMAEQGERWAAEFVRDTVDGKPFQRVAVSGDEDGGPINIRQVVLTALEPKVSDPEGE